MQCNHRTITVTVRHMPDGSIEIDISWTSGA